MKRLCLTLTALIISLTFFSQALDKAAFTAKSVLSEGKWVKIAISQTGIHEISYEELREMGFEHPEKISLYGKGGEMLNLNFTNSTGDPNIYDDLGQVFIWHKNNKIYFYARGAEDIKFRVNRNSTLKGNFIRSALNIYSSKGYYFLTDSGPQKNITPIFSSETSSLPIKEESIRYLYHERDLEFNTTSTGQLFWGESLVTEEANICRWKLDLPDLIPGRPGWLQSEIYVSDGVEGEQITGMAEFGMEGSIPIEVAVRQQSSVYKPIGPVGREIGNLTDGGNFYIRLTTDVKPEAGNVDYWLISYTSGIPKLKTGCSENQARFGITGLVRKEKFRFLIPDAVSFAIMDISDLSDPSIVLPESISGNGSFGFTPNSTYGEFIIFDTARRQHEIAGYSEINNQDLHRIMHDGADLLIITTPEFKEHAEKIAELHSATDGQEVAVTTTEECYNEFSGGVPDPMAYRTLAKMMYLGNKGLKNILLMGPLSNDLRGVTRSGEERDEIIAFQGLDINKEQGAPNVNDFFGMMADNISFGSLERTNVEVGIGILPIRFKGEGDTYVSKLEKYLKDESHAYTLNRNVLVGGSLDKNLHTRQACTIGDWIKGFDDGASVNIPVMTEAYGNKIAGERLVEEFEHGINYMIYFGHGGEGQLGKDRTFITTANISDMANETLPVALFAGCRLSTPDRGRKGLGEALVTGTPHGAIASILATRETWASQNQDFFKSFFRLNFLENDISSSPRLTATRTLGEIFAKLKTGSLSANEQAYCIIGDPAIRIPVPLRKVIIKGDLKEAEAGEDIEIEGIVDNGSGGIDRDYNGDCVISLMQPSIIRMCENLVSARSPAHLDTVDLPIEYAHTRLSTASTKVENGTFKAKLHIPLIAGQFNGSKGNLHVAVYDPSTGTGGGAMKSLIFKSLPEGKVSSEEKDITPPSIDRLELREEEGDFLLEVSDNYALSFSEDPLIPAVRIWIDGTEYYSGRRTVERTAYADNRTSRVISLDGLRYGDHIIKVKVRDSAGNTAEKETRFTFTPGKNIYRLRIMEYSPETGVVFGFEGSSPDTKTLYICDSANNLVKTIESADILIWDLTDSDGRRVEPGHYKAYIRERGNKRYNGYSEIIDVPVI